MVYRVYVEKKKELASEAKSLLADAKNLLGITALEDVRIINRYDVENIEPELFEYAKKTVFSEPQVDIVSDGLDAEGTVLAVEYLPGQFDQRADSAAQCIQIISRGERPDVRTAKIYVLGGALSEAEINEIKKYVINPVEAREASLDMPETLKIEYNKHRKRTSQAYGKHETDPVTTTIFFAVQWPNIIDIMLHSIYF